MVIKSKVTVILIILLLSVFSYGSSCEIDLKSVTIKVLFDNAQSVLREDININSIDENVEKWEGSINVDGCWLNINYANSGRATWEPYAHLSHILDMSHAFTNINSAYYKNNKLNENIIKGLEYWIKKTPYCVNWWYNDIAVPQCIGKILIVLEGTELIKQPLKSALIHLMDRGSLEVSTGANKVDMALHHLMRGMLTANESLIVSTSRNLFGDIKRTDGEGIQIDNSYHQHGSQLYISGYGDVFIERVLVLAQYLHGTKYALPEEQLNILSSFVLDGFLPIFRGCYKDYNAGGRLLTRKNALNYRGFVKQLRILERLDKKNQERYIRAISQIQDGRYDIVDQCNKLYWRSDYMIHNRCSYSASVRAASKRIYRVETAGNGENLKGTLISAGSMSVRVSGNEYFNIFPCWNWSRIPGITSIKNYVPIINGNDWGSLGSGEFIGGISNENIGAFVLDYDEFGIKVHKGYFFFENEIVCLGSMINCNANEMVNTTIEQNRLMGEIYVLNQDNLVVKNAFGQSLKDIKGVLHNQIGYFINSNSDIELSKENSAGSWRDINSSASEETVYENIFSLVVNHGIKPVSDAYAYTIIPNIKTVEDFKTYPIQNIKIVQNSKDIQAVANEATKALQIIFYNKGEFCYNDVSVTVDSPMMVLISNYEKMHFIYVSDPTQALNNAKLTLNGNDYNISFLKKDLVGKSVRIRVDGYNY